MKLKLSTLLVIIVAIFLAFYYFNFTPQQMPQQLVPQEDVPVMLPPPMEEGVTVLEEEMPMMENFEVTMLEDEPDYGPSGNVRPDNVMYTDEMTFDL